MLVEVVIRWRWMMYVARKCRPSRLQGRAEHASDRESMGSTNDADADDDDEDGRWASYGQAGASFFFAFPFSLFPFPFSFLWVLFRGVPGIGSGDRCWGSRGGNETAREKERSRRGERGRWDRDRRISQRSVQAITGPMHGAKMAREALEGPKAV